MVLSCCVCKKRFKAGDNTIYHTFPRNNEMRLRWLTLLKYSGEPKSWRICSDHFKPEDYVPAVVSGKPRLRDKAEPSVNLEKFTKSNMSHDTEIHSETDSNNIDRNNTNNNDISMLEIELVKIEPIDTETEFLDIRLEPTFEFCDLGATTVSNQLYDHDKNLAIPEEPANDANCISETTNPPVKRECPSPNVDVWADYANDKEFMKYKRIQDVNWENVVNDPQKSTICWEVALETIGEQREELKKLRSKVRALESKIRTLTRQMNIRKLLSGSATITAKTNPGKKSRRTPDSVVENSDANSDMKRQICNMDLQN